MSDITPNLVGIRPKPKTGGSISLVTVEVPAGYKLLLVHPDYHYQLGDPHDEILQGHHLTGAAMVYWDTLEQKWRDS